MAGSLRVRDYMTRKVLTIRPETGIMQAVHFLVEKDISGAPVVDDDGTLLGMLTERDCIKVALQSGYFDEPGGIVADYMSHPVETVAPDTSLMDLAEQLTESRYRRYPVLEDGRLVGLIGRRDVLRALRGGSWFTRRSSAR